MSHTRFATVVGRLADVIETRREGDASQSYTAQSTGGQGFMSVNKEEP